MVPSPTDRPPSHWPDEFSIGYGKAAVRSVLL